MRAHEPMGFQSGPYVGGREGQGGRACAAQGPWGRAGLAHLFSPLCRERTATRYRRVHPIPQPPQANIYQKIQRNVKCLTGTHDDTEGSLPPPARRLLLPPRQRTTCTHTHHQRLFDHRRVTSSPPAGPLTSDWDTSSMLRVSGTSVFTRSSISSSSPYGSVTPTNSPSARTIFQSCRAIPGGGKTKADLFCGAAAEYTRSIARNGDGRAKGGGQAQRRKQPAGSNLLSFCALCPSLCTAMREKKGARTTPERGATEP